MAMNSSGGWWDFFVAEDSLRILQVNSADLAGGAERVAWNLFQAYRRRGYQSWLAVGLKQSEDPDVFCLENEELKGSWARFWLRESTRLNASKKNSRGKLEPSRLARKAAEPVRSLHQFLGLEDFNFPGAWELLNLTPEAPTLVHCHNLHGDYFDLRALAWLSKKIPVVLTLHDAWLLSGHCAHSFDCERWQTGCGQCPDLTIYPAIRRDATAYNWRRKRRIFAASRLYVSTRCQWLMDRVQNSMLRPAIKEARVIPTGIDLSVFHPGDRNAARAKLNLPDDARILLFAANRARRGIWKDYQTMHEAILRVEADFGQRKLIFVTLGDEGPSERLGKAEVRFIPFQTNVTTVADYYRAADVYLHAARADTFPNTVLEALACATPVVATAIGGIPEQIDDGKTGFLVPLGDSVTMAKRTTMLLEDDRLRTGMGMAAAESAIKRFSLDREVDDHLKWYREILKATVFAD
jgi:glycosyltransferase involved in cell wall biosynthesis